MYSASEIFKPKLSQRFCDVGYITQNTFWNNLSRVMF